MKTLENTYPNPEKRLEVILTEMLHFADINPLNVYITKLLLDPTGKYHKEMNYHIGDTLKLDVREKWKIDGFELVIGNPPYNNMQNNKGKKGGGDSLWDKFVVKSLDVWVKKGAYLCYVHPSGWRKPESDKSKFKGLFSKMCHENQMVYLEIHDSKDGVKTFNCGTRYDWYVIQNVLSFEVSKVRDEKDKLGEVNLQEWCWLPNYNFENVAKLLAKDGDKVCVVIQNMYAYETRRDWVSKTMDDKHKYILIHSTCKSGVRYMYSSRNDLGHFGVPKVIFGETGVGSAVIDIEGLYGMTQGSMAIPINDENNGKTLIDYLQSQQFKDILDCCSWSNFRIDWRLFTYFKKDFWI